MRVGHEPFGGQPGAIEIASRQAQPGDVELTGHTHRNRPQTPSRTYTRVFQIGRQSAHGKADRRSPAETRKRWQVVRFGRTIMIVESSGSQTKQVSQPGVSGVKASPALERCWVRKRLAAEPSLNQRRRQAPRGRSLLQTIH